jgi:predicted DNA-binding transcriptional regulator AlpA
MIEPLVIPLAEVAALFGIHRDSAYRMHREGTFPIRVMRIGGEKSGKLVCSRKDVDEFVNPSDAEDVA